MCLHLLPSFYLSLSSNLFFRLIFFTRPDIVSPSHTIASFIVSCVFSPLFSSSRVIFQFFYTRCFQKYSTAHDVCVLLLLHYSSFIPNIHSNQPTCFSSNNIKMEKTILYISGSRSFPRKLIFCVSPGYFRAVRGHIIDLRLLIKKKTPTPHIHTHHTQLSRLFKENLSIIPSKTTRRYTLSFSLTSIPPNKARRPHTIPSIKLPTHPPRTRR